MVLEQHKSNTSATRNLINKDLQRIAKNHKPQVIEKFERSVIRVTWKKDELQAKGSLPSTSLSHSPPSEYAKGQA